MGYAYTNRRANPYPDELAWPDVPADIQRLAEALDDSPHFIQGTRTARRSQTPLYDGLYWYETDTDTLWVRNQGDWKCIGGNNQAQGGITISPAAVPSPILTVPFVATGRVARVGLWVDATSSGFPYLQPKFNGGLLFIPNWVSPGWLKIGSTIDHPQYAEGYVQTPDHATAGSTGFLTVELVGTGNFLGNISMHITES